MNLFDLLAPDEITRRRDEMKGQPLKVFDWDKAAQMIKEELEENPNCDASAGLQDDWSWTGGGIFENGKPTNDSYTYLASIWATPELRIDNVYYECYLMKDDVPKEWGTNYADIKWPESSLKILGLVQEVSEIKQLSDGF